MKINKILLILPFTSLIFAGCGEEQKNPFTKDDIVINVSSLSLETFTSMYVRVNNEKLNDFVNWSVTDSTIASIDQNGKVTGLKAGSTSIDATYKDLKSTITVTVNDPLSNPYLVFNCGDSTNLFVGQSFTFKTDLYFKGEKVENVSYSYETDNASIATVNSKGTITANSAGVANITVSTTYLNNFVAGQIKVNVLNSPSSISVINLPYGNDGYELEIDVEEIFVPYLMVIENGCLIDKPDIIYQSIDPSIATFSEGIITGINSGETTVIANYKNICVAMIDVTVL